MKSVVASLSTGVLGVSALLLCVTPLVFADPVPQVQVAYADVGVHASDFAPSPWLGDPGVIFIGTTSPWDAGAINLFNPKRKKPITVVNVTVDIGSVTGLAPWSGSVPITIPGRESLILTQTAFFNFDTSDVLAGSCGSPNSLIPVIHVTLADGPPEDWADT